MPASLLASQFATLEEPRDAIVVDIALPVAAQVAAITRALQAQLPA
jgi:gluconate kinase